MNDLNRWEGIGRLGADPELRSLPSGSSVANISMACGTSWKDKSTGEKKEKTEWVRIAVFGPLADICGRYLTKGSQVFFAGRLQTRKWQDSEGSDRYSTEVVVDGFNGVMQMLGSKDGAERATNPLTQAPAQDQAPSKPAPAAAQPQQDDFDDDIPF